MSSIPSIRLSLVCLLLAGGLPDRVHGQGEHAGSPVEELKTQFKELQSDLWGDLEKLDALYLQQLTKLKQTAQGAANLDLVLEVDTEIGLLSDASKTDRALSKLPDLARLQQIYDSESKRLKGVADQKLESLFRVYATRLESLEKDLTVSGKIDLALEARREKERVLSSLEKIASTASNPESAPSLSRSQPLTPVKSVLGDDEAITGNISLEPGLHRVGDKAVIGVRGGGKDIQGHVVSNAGTGISSGRVYIHNGSFRATETLFYKVVLSQELQGRWIVKSSLFDSCQFKKEGGWEAGPYSARWHFENCVFEDDFFTSWWSVGLNIADCTFHGIEFLPFSYKKDAGTEAVSDGRQIRNCLFVDCTIPASTALATKDCLFRNCKFTDDMGNDPVVNTPIEAVLYIDGSDFPPAIKLPDKATLVFKHRSEAGDLKFGSTVPYSLSGGKLLFR